MATAPWPTAGRNSAVDSNYVTEVANAKPIEAGHAEYRSIDIAGIDLANSAVHIATQRAHVNVRS